MVGGYDEISVRRRRFLDMLVDLAAAAAVSTSVSADKSISIAMLEMKSRIESRSQIV